MLSTIKECCSYGEQGAYGLPIRAALAKSLENSATIISMFNLQLGNLQNMDFDILLENISFLGTVYDLRILMWAFIFFMLLDTVLKGWGMWRAAIMGKKIWFVVLLTANSMGIVPLFFLKLTNKEYKALQTQKSSDSLPGLNQGDTAA